MEDSAGGNPDTVGALAMVGTGATHLQPKDPGLPTFDNLADTNRWWANKGLRALETCNGNSWGSLKQAMLGRSAADVVLAQETKIFSWFRPRGKPSGLAGTPRWSLRIRPPCTMALGVGPSWPRLALALPP